MSFFLFINSYLAIINIIAVFVMYHDKNKAKSGGYRISEATIWKIAWMGGALGCTVGMHLFRHKTKKGYFPIGLPVITGLFFMLYSYITFQYLFN